MFSGFILINKHPFLIILKNAANMSLMLLISYILFFFHMQTPQHELLKFLHPSYAADLHTTAFYPNALNKVLVYFNAALSPSDLLYCIQQIFYF